MPTGASSTSTALLRPVRDVGHLLRFRAETVRRRGLAAWILLVLGGGTVAAAVAPAFVDGAGTGERAGLVAELLPAGFAAFLLVALVSAVVSGGGRELLPREQAAIHPISPTTDHLGALLFAPLNISWLLQAWTLLGSTAYAFGPAHLPTALPVVAVWVVAATALAQAVAWVTELVRRAPHGVATVRAVTVVIGATALGLHLSGRLAGVPGSLPTAWWVDGASAGAGWRWAATVLAGLLLAVAGVLAGIAPAHAAARRAPRDEVRLESGVREARPDPRSDLLALLRTDRASVWRAVPMRRGLGVLAVGPGLVALVGDLPWSSLTILPALVASGGALLFGVNAWCLDGRGALWRESQPVPPGPVFTARALVLAEFLLAASLLTIAIASVRAGLPDTAEATALLCTLVVVIVQVVAAGLRWSGRRPYAVDLRSARATPAPPVVMVGYSARLALSTTLTSLVFSGLAGAAPPWVSAVVALLLLAWSSVRLLRTRARWLDPDARARIIATVAA